MTAPLVPSTQDARGRRFLERYQDSADPHRMVAELFAPHIVVADPAGSHCLPRDVLAAGIAQREAGFRSAGLTSTALVSWAGTALGEQALLVASRWRLTFRPPGGRPIAVELDSDHLLQEQADGLRCIVYLARQDVGAMLAEVGLT